MGEFVGRSVTASCSSVPEHRLLVTVEEAARLTSLGRTTAYALVASGEWPSVAVGRAVRVPLNDLEDWIEMKKGGHPKETGTGRSNP